MTPGPVPLSKEILSELALPIIHHRTPQFQQILEQSLKGLKLLFATTQPVLELVSTGTGAMEAALVNTLSPGDEILCINGGKFGERWVKMAKAFGYKAHELSVPWGEAVSPQLVSQRLSENPQICAVFMQACETSTGCLHPFAEIAQITKELPHCLLVVDGITAVGAMDISMDRDGIDVLIAGSQKALMLPTGMAFISLSEKAWGFYNQSNSPKFYFDLGLEKAANEKRQTHFSSAVTLIRALNKSLKLLTGGNKKISLERCNTLALATQKACAAMGLKLLAEKPSPSLTAILLPDNLDGVAFRQHIEDAHNIVVMGGQDHYKGKIIRIGHMGFIQDEDLYETLGAIGHSLIHFNQSISIEQIEKALQTAQEVLKTPL